jgi:hypothetical protein
MNANKYYRMDEAMKMFAAFAANPDMLAKLMDFVGTQQAGQSPSKGEPLPDASAHLFMRTTPVESSSMTSNGMLVLFLCVSLRLTLKYDLVDKSSSHPAPVDPPEEVHQGRSQVRRSPGNVDPGPVSPSPWSPQADSPAS